VQRAGFDEVALRNGAGVRLRGMLPLGFGRQAAGHAVLRGAPMRVGFGFEIADVNDRRVGVDRRTAVQREVAPALAFALPVSRRIDAIGVPPIPARGEPPARIAVATVVDEGQPLAVGHQPIGQRVRPQQRGMARRFVVERKIITVVADQGRAAFERQPRLRHRADA
jgi:hypothetical protein